MKVLLVGGSGQLGGALLAGAPADARIVAPPRSELDVTDAASIRRCVRAHDPDVIVNAAGYTQVERAESEPERALAVNATGVESLARAALEANSRLLNVSTDYVFDGAQSRPYREDDPALPLNAYGRSKLEGERRAHAALGDRALTIRTAWLYGAPRGNFVATMLKLMREQPLVRVVFDQVGTPTSARSLASALWRACARPGVCGVLHWTDAGVASWYDFAVAIHEEAMHAGVLEAPVEIRPIPATEYPARARRPPYSVLDCRRAQEALELTPLHWRARLREVIREVAWPVSS